MPVLINRCPRRYQPYSQPLALHLIFPSEKHFCSPHSLYLVFPADSDITAFDPPRPILATGIVLPDMTYFASIALGWPEEVYKDVQVSYLFRF